MAESVRVPISVAAERGIDWLIADAADHRVVLTSHGEPVAVIDSAERIDEAVRAICEAALTVVDAAAHLV